MMRIVPILLWFQPFQPVSLPGAEDCGRMRRIYDVDIAPGAVSLFT